ncbi:MAG: hypothetical protein AAGI07_16885 [Bacteroidota bacterium]
MKTTLLILITYFLAAPFEITEEARRFMDDHQISFVRKKNSVILYNSDSFFEYKTVVEKCHKISLHKNELHILYAKGEIKFVYEQGEFIRYHRKNAKASWEGYRLRRDPSTVINASYNSYLFERNINEFQYRVLAKDAQAAQ